MKSVNLWASSSCHEWWTSTKQDVRPFNLLHRYWISNTSERAHFIERSFLKVHLLEDEFLSLSYNLNDHSTSEDEADHLLLGVTLFESERSTGQLSAEYNYKSVHRPCKYISNSCQRRYSNFDFLKLPPMMLIRNEGNQTQFSGPLYQEFIWLSQRLHFKWITFYFRCTWDLILMSVNWCFFQL